MKENPTEVLIQIYFVQIIYFFYDDDDELNNDKYF